MRILYFGNFDTEYARNRVIIRGLRLNKSEVLICREDAKNIAQIVRLIKRFRVMVKKCDLVVVGYSDSRFLVPLARLFGGKKVIWDAFYSLYDSWVFDRGLVSKNSVKAYFYWFLDWLNCKLAHFVLIDTGAHARYFSETFGIEYNKFGIIWIGADDSVFIK